MVREPATERLDIRIAPAELAMLRKLADATGLPVSTYLRQTIRRAYAEAFGNKKP
jgi:predicted DNA binding CopG/RHH family protein